VRVCTGPACGFRGRRCRRGFVGPLWHFRVGCVVRPSRTKPTPSSSDADHPTGDVRGVSVGLLLPRPEDRALLKSNSSAVPAAETEGRVVPATRLSSASGLAIRRQTSGSGAEPQCPSRQREGDAVAAASNGLGSCCILVSGWVSVGLAVEDQDVRVMEQYD